VQHALGDNPLARQDLQDTLDVLTSNFNQLAQLVTIGLGDVSDGATTPTTPVVAGNVVCYADTTGLALEDGGKPCDRLVDVDRTGIAVDDQIKWNGSAWIFFTPGASGGEPFKADGTVIHLNDGTPGQKEVLVDVTYGKYPLQNADNVILSVNRTSRQNYGFLTAPNTNFDGRQRLVTQRDLNGANGDGQLGLTSYANSIAGFTDGPYQLEVRTNTGSHNFPYNYNCVEINQKPDGTNSIYRGMGGKISFGYNNGNGQAKVILGAACAEPGTGAVSENTNAAFFVSVQQQTFTRNCVMSSWATDSTNYCLWLGTTSGSGSVRFPARTDGGVNINEGATFANTPSPTADSIDFWTESGSLWGKLNDGSGTVVRVGPNQSELPGVPAPLVTSADGGTVTANGNQFTVNLPASGNANVVVTTPFIPGVMVELNCQASTAIGTGNGLSAISFGDGSDVDRFGVLGTFTINSLVNRDNWTVTTEQQGGVYWTVSTSGSTSLVLTPTGNWGGGTLVITIFINNSTVITYV
jgi:hypothetical protein